MVQINGYLKEVAFLDYTYHCLKEHGHVLYDKCNLLREDRITLRDKHACAEKNNAFLANKAHRPLTKDEEVDGEGWNKLIDNAHDLIKINTRDVDALAYKCKELIVEDTALENQYEHLLKTRSSLVSDIKGPGDVTTPWNELLGEETIEAQEKIIKILENTLELWKKRIILQEDLIKTREDLIKQQKRSINLWKARIKLWEDSVEVWKDRKEVWLYNLKAQLHTQEELLQEREYKITTLEAVLKEREDKTTALEAQLQSHAAALKEREDKTIIGEAALRKKIRDAWGASELVIQSSI